MISSKGLSFRFFFCFSLCFQKKSVTLQKKRNMLKILLRLWWIQQRRNFSWREALVGCYIIILYIIIGVSFYIGFTEGGGELFEDGVPSTIGVGMTMGMLLPDIISKFVMKRDATAIDDYVKSRPIPEKTWNHFLLLTNVASFWNYVLPMLMLPVLFWLLSVSQAIVVFLMLLVYSYIDGIYITCYRKSNEFMLKWPLVVGWAGMYMLLVGYFLFAFWMPEWMVYVGMFVLAGLVFVGLTLYLCNLKIYNETKRKASHYRTWGKTTLFSLQYIGLIRAKRIRNMVLMMVVIYFFDSLLMALMPYMDEQVGVEGSEQGQMVLYVVGDVLLPSVVLSQMTFGIEANFFQGLMSKPIQVRQLLRNCYYFYLIISGVMAILAIPFMFLSSEITVLSLLGAYAMSVIVNLTNLPTCLYSSRLEIFSGAVFGGKSGKIKINLYGILFLIPTGILAGIYYLWGEQVWEMVAIVSGVVAWAVHRKVITKLASVFEDRKYQRMEKYLES